jgi:4-hydroxy-4-methyl-2-oxoglutarate aldolase
MVDAKDQDATVALFDELCRLAYAGAVSDVLDGMGLRGQAISPLAGITPVDRKLVMVGRARTLLNDEDNCSEEPYELAIRAMDEMQPGEVLVCTGTKPLITGIFGELSASRVRKAGGRGALVNGFSRDGRKILEMQFPLFCKGMSPIDTTARARVVDYNCPVEIGGVRIEPGQLIFADYDGMVVIPREAEGEAVVRILQRVSDESVLRAELNSGVTLAEVWRKYRIL